MRVKLAQFGEDGWVLAHPISLHLPSPVRCSVRSIWVGRYTNPVASLVKICTLWKKSPSAPPPPPTPCCGGEGGEGNNYAFRGRGRGLESFLGTSCKEILRKRPSNFYWNCNFSLLFSLLTHFRFHFFRCLECSAWLRTKQKKNIFFRFKARTKIPTFSLVFALSEYERRTLIVTWKAARAGWWSWKYFP